MNRSNRNPLLSRRQFLELGGGLTLLAIADRTPPCTRASRPNDVTVFACRSDHVLGTSMNLLVRAEHVAAAENAWREAFEEIEQFDRECSGYRDDTPMAAMNRGHGWVSCGSRLLELLRSLETASSISGGVVVPWIRGIAALWRDRGRAGQVPGDEELLAALHDARSMRIEIDPAGRRVRRVGAGTINVDAIGKALAVDRVATRLAGLDGIQSVLAEIGGDVRAASRDPDDPGWPVAIADPRSPFDNAEPLALVALRHAATCTSGPSRRTDRGDAGFSHIFSPFDGKPVSRLRSASVIAPTAVMANALATAGVVLGGDELSSRCEQVPGVAAMFVEPDGNIRSSTRMRGWLLGEDGAASEDVLPGGAGEDPPPACGFKNGWLVEITLRLPRLNVRKYRRPYVAVWIEDAAGKPVRTLAVWGNEREYLREMTAWWKVAGGNRQLIAAVTRATRPPGEYKLAWDGKRDDGSHVEPDTYIVCVEVNREYGQHLVRKVKLPCLDEPSQAKIAASAELDETVATFGPPPTE